MVRTRLVLASTLLACVAAMLAAVPSSALPSAAPSSTSATAAEECGELGRTVARVWSGRRTEEGPACATIPFAGSVTLRFVQPVGEERVPVRVVDARGEVLCEAQDGPTCHVYGSNHTPYRAVVEPGPAQDFHLSVVKLGTPRRGCPPLPVGAFGTRDGVDLELGGDGAFVACHTVPAEELRGTPDVFAFERVSGAGQARLMVRGEFLGSFGRECSTEAPAPAGSAVCGVAEHTGWTATVLLVTDGQAAGWRLVRRDPSRVGQCTPVTSTSVDGPVSLGAPSSYVDLDCWRVDAAPSDRFFVDVVDADGSTGFDTFREGWYRCAVDTVDCNVTGADRHVLVPRRPTAASSDGAPYELQPWRVAGIEGWDPACSRDVSGDFGPLTGTLSSSSGGRCVVVGDVGGTYHVESATEAPEIRGIGRYRHSACLPQEGGASRCRFFNTPFNTGLVLLSRPDGVGTLDYEVTGSCEGQPQWYCELLPSPTVVEAPGVTGRHVPGSTLSVSDGRWSPEVSRYYYDWYIDGFAVGSGPTLKLTEEMVGREVRARVITENTIREGGVWLSEPREVRPAVLGAPTVTGVPRVGERFRVDPGRWHQEVERFRFTWFAGDDRLAAEGRTLDLRPRHAGRVVRVLVTGVGEDGEARGSATARAGRVRR